MRKKVKIKNADKKKRYSVTKKIRYNSGKGFKKSNIFEFSGKAKLIMTNAEIGISSIESSSDKNVRKIHKNKKAKNIAKKKNSIFFADSVKEYIYYIIFRKLYKELIMIKKIL